MKMKFFDLLLFKEKQAEAEHYYFEFLRGIVKEVKKANFEHKDRLFLRILKHPNLLKNKNVLERNYSDFSFKFNKELYNYLYQRSSSNNYHNTPKCEASESLSITNSEHSNQHNNILPVNGMQSQSTNQAVNTTEHTSNQENNNHTTTNVNPNPDTDPNPNENEDLCHQEDRKDLSQLSTNEELSDFEESLGGVPCIADTEANSDIYNQGPPLHISQSKHYI